MRLERITIRPPSPGATAVLPQRPKPYRVSAVAFRFTVVNVPIHTAVWQLADSTGGIIAAGYSDALAPNEDNLVSFSPNCQIAATPNLAAPPFLRIAFLPPDLWVLPGEVFSCRVEEGAAGDTWALLLASLMAVE